MKKSLLFLKVPVDGPRMHALDNIEEEEIDPGPAGTRPDIVARGRDTPGTKEMNGRVRTFPARYPRIDRTVR